MEHLQTKDKEGLLVSIEVLFEKAGEQMKKLKAEVQSSKAEAEKLKAEADGWKAVAKMWETKDDDVTKPTDAEGWKASAKMWESEARKSIAAVAEEVKAEGRKWKQDAENWKAEAEKLKAEVQESKAEAEGWKVKANEPVDAQVKKWKADADYSKTKAEKCQADASSVKAGMLKVGYEYKAEAEKWKAEAEKWKAEAEKLNPRLKMETVPAYRVYGRFVGFDPPSTAVEAHRQVEVFKGMVKDVDARRSELDGKIQTLHAEKKALNAGIIRALDFKVAAGTTKYWCQESFFDEVGTNHDGESIMRETVSRILPPHSPEKSGNLCIIR